MILAALANWRLIALGLAVAAIVGFVALALHWRKEAAVERLRADTEAARAGLAQSTARTVETYHTTTRIITEKAEAKADEIEAIPSDMLPDSVRGPWLAELRDGSGAPDDHGGAQPAGGLR